MSTMSKRVDVMVDIETLGKGACPPLVQLNAKAFDIRTGEVLDSINMLCDISTSDSKIEAPTLLWWMKTNSSLLAELMQGGIDAKRSEKQMIEEFVQWFQGLGSKEDVFLWGNGVLFDNRIVQSKCAQYGIEYPVFYRNDMDMRTVVEIAAMKRGMKNQTEYRDAIGYEGILHNADDDVSNQIRFLTRAFSDLIS